MHINERPTDMYDNAFLASVRPKDNASDLQILSASVVDDAEAREKTVEKQGGGLANKVFIAQASSAQKEKIGAVSSG